MEIYTGYLVVVSLNEKALKVVMMVSIALMVLLHFLFNYILS